jgi:hypothetical protein
MTVVWQRLKRALGFSWRSPVGLATIGVAATLVLALMVIFTLLLTGDSKTLSDNAALIGAVIALGGVFTAQMVNSALDNRRAHETALQNYFEQVGKLLIERPLHRASPGEKLSTIVRAQTLSVLEGLDPDRKGILLQFLQESALIHRAKPVVNLAYANLRGANLRGADLSFANLSNADLLGADLSLTFLFFADLRGAELYGADLFETALHNADLRDADLRNAFLFKIRLRGANLSGARGVTNEELAKQASYLDGAAMPDGQTYEDWIESVSRGEDGENRDSS